MDSKATVRRVLDHGLVRLVDHMGTDLSVVRAARNSYDGAWRAGEDTGSDDKLIRYLWSNRHSTPFESVTFTWEIHAPIFVFRQWHRHRTWSYNEISARYTELPEKFYVPEPQTIGTAHAKNKQARVFNGRDEVTPGMIELACRASFDTYRKLLARGVPREIARSVLPVATYSGMFATVNLLNLFKFIELRIHEHAQYEIRVYAEAMLQLARGVAPVSVAAFEEGLKK